MNYAPKIQKKQYIDSQFWKKIKHPIVFGKQALIFGKHTPDYWEAFAPFSASYSAFRTCRTCTKN